MLSFLFLHENICCGYPLEAARRGASNEYPQHMFSWRNKTDIMRIPPLICNYDFYWPTEDAFDPWLPTECPAKTDQTAWMRRLILVIAGCTYSLEGNAVPWLTFFVLCYVIYVNIKN